jgi:RHH-type transcriptional regulator, rel operon repressor / antitoxin RelB
MPTSIRLEPELERCLTELVKRTGRSKSFYLHEMIRRSFEDVHDYYIAEAAMERHRRGQERTYTLEEVSAELGLDDRAA